MSPGKPKTLLTSKDLWEGSAKMTISSILGLFNFINCFGDVILIPYNVGTFIP